MIAHVIAAAAGIVFAIGLAIADMTSPARVRAFLDVGGDWDPTLAFVMAGAIAIYAPLARLARTRTRPLLAPAFDWPSTARIDRALVGGAAIFGVGWGLSGYCPGPALVALGAGTLPVIVFVGALLAGIVLTRLVIARR